MMDEPAGMCKREGRCARTSSNYRGQSLGLFTQHGAVKFKKIRISTDF